MQAVKDEVKRILEEKVGLRNRMVVVRLPAPILHKEPSSSSFLGASLTALSSLFLTATPNTDVMSEFDRLDQ